MSNYDIVYLERIAKELGFVLIQERIKNHPMTLWKTRDLRDTVLENNKRL